MRPVGEEALGVDASLAGTAIRQASEEQEIEMSRNALT